MAKNKQGKKVDKNSDSRSRKSSVIKSSAGAIPAEIMEIAGKVNTKQGGKQVRCKLLAGKETGKIMRRNVIGPVRVGDILLLMETEIEARQTGKGRRG